MSSKTLKTIAIATSCLFALNSGLVSAQVQPPPKPADQPKVQPAPANPAQVNPAQAGQQQAAPQAGQPQQPAVAVAYRVKQVLGSKISIEGGVSIGVVDDMVFDDNGQVEYLIVQNEGKLVTIPWAAARFNFTQRSATVDITSAQYQKIPTYTPQQYPAYFSQPYRNQTYQYYGLTPRENRIINRRAGF